MTGKQKSMVEERLKDPKASNAEIIKRSGYNITGQGNKATNTASQIYLENMRNPEIATLLNDVVNEVESILVKNIRENKDSDIRWKRELSNENAKWIHDKVRGKATQQLNINSTTVTLSIDMTASEDL